MMSGHSLLVEHQSLEELKCQFLVVGPVGWSGESLTTVLKAELHPARWAAAARLVLEGTVAAFLEDQPSKRLFERVLVEPRELLTELQKVDCGPLPSDVFVSSLVASRLLGLSDPVVNEAVRAGLIAGIPGRTFQITLDALSAFRSSYCTAREFVGTNPGATREFARRMREQNVAPVATLLRANIWHRREVELAL
jgi:hypothetical protein